MITGRVNEFYEAIIPIYLLDTHGLIHEIEAILDTGFNGTLTLPADLIQSLKMSWRTRGNAVLANGQDDVFDIYTGEILWDEKPRSILVEAVDMQPLAGMRLLANSNISMKVQPGGVVQIFADS